MQYHKINNAELSSIVGGDFVGGEVTGYLVTVLHVLLHVQLIVLFNTEGILWEVPHKWIFMKIIALDHFYRNIWIVCLQETL